MDKTVDSLAKAVAPDGSHRLFCDSLPSPQRSAQAPQAETPRTLDPLAQGIGQGIAQELDIVARYLATPGSANNALMNLWQEVGTAGNYYAGKLSHGRLGQIKDDAASAGRSIDEWISAIPQKSAYEKGQLIGELSTQLLLAQTGGALLRGCMLGLGKTGEFLSAGKLLSKDVPLPALAEQKALLFERVPSAAPAIVQFPGTSTEFYAAVKEAARVLPRDVRLMLEHNGIGIAVIPDARSISQKAAFSTRGIYNSEHRTIFMAENFRRGGNRISEFETTGRVLQHEVAHVMDTLDKGGVKLSDGRVFCDAYAADITEMPAAVRKSFDYYGIGDARARREAFAESYAILHSVPNCVDARWRALFVRSFPNMIEAVKEAGLPG